MTQSQTDVDEQQLYRRAYRSGYKYAKSLETLKNRLQNSECPSELWMNGNDRYQPVSDVVKTGQTRHSYARTIYRTEEDLCIEAGEGWGDHYPVIEDVAMAWEAGAYHSLLDKDKDPTEVPFINE